MKNKYIAVASYGTAFQLQMSKSDFDRTKEITGQSNLNNPKIQNNEPCPCGSGLKYKKCCKK